MLPRSTPPERCGRLLGACAAFSAQQGRLELLDIGWRDKVIAFYRFFRKRQVPLS
jgi:hypothetical protein